MPLLIKKKDKVETIEFRILRLLSSVSNPIDLHSFEHIDNLKINDLTKLRNQGYIFVNDNFVEITDIGKKRYLVLFDEIYL